MPLPCTRGKRMNGLKTGAVIFTFVAGVGGNYGAIFTADFSSDAGSINSIKIDGEIRD